MNRCYRIIFNRRLKGWQAIAKILYNLGKTGGTLRITTGLLIGLISPSVWACVGWGGGVQVAGGAIQNDASGVIDCTENATVTGSGSQWNIQGDLTLSHSTGTSTMSVEDGGSVSNAVGYIGYNPGSIGMVTVTGANSTWTNSSNLFVGDAGTGTLNIEAGGRVSNISSYIGRNIGGSGTVTVTGAGSVWATATNLTVGDGGEGTLNITDGATVSSMVGVVGSSSGGTGAVTIVGAGSRWMGLQSLAIGAQGTGTLMIEDGGKVGSIVGDIGLNIGSTGTATVTGANSTWENSGVLYVGRSGTGILNIQDGGSVSNDYGYLGLNIGSTGTATVTGANSSWKDSGDFYIGREGTGILKIEAGGSFSSASIRLGALGAGNGTLNLNGTSGARGVLATGYLYKGAGTAAFNWNGGILRATADEVNFLRSFTAGVIDVQAGGAYFDSNGFNVGITTAGMLAGNGGLTKLGAGTLSIAGANTYGGNTTVSDGTLQFDDYTQSASQTLGIGASSNAHYGKLLATNAATFAADSNIAVDVAGINTLAKDQILAGVISATTLNASTFNVTDNSALFNFEAIRNGNAIDLRISSHSNAGVYDAVMGTGTYSAAGAANVLDKVIDNGASGDMATVVNALGSLASDSDVSRAAAQTLPLLSSGVTQIGKGVLNSVNRLIQNRQAGGSSGLSGGDDISNRAAWLKPFGSRADQDDRNGVSGFNASTWGLAGGIEGDLDNTTRLGLAYAYANSKVDGNTNLSGTQQRVDIDAHVIALYGTTELANGMTLGLQGDIGQNNNEGTRHINFGGLDRTATSDYKTITAHAGISLAKTLAINERTSFTSTIRADYTWLRDDSYQEQGAGALNLDVAKQSNDAFVIGADAHFSHTLTERSRIEANAGVGYDTINNPGNVVSSYAGSPGQVFGTQGTEHSPWLFVTGIGYLYNTTGGTEISVRYDVEGRSDYLNQSASLKAKWAF